MVNNYRHLDNDQSFKFSRNFFDAFGIVANYRNYGWKFRAYVYGERQRSKRFASAKEECLRWVVEIRGEKEVDGSRRFGVNVTRCFLRMSAKFAWIKQEGWREILDI